MDPAGTRSDHAHHTLFALAGDPSFLRAQDPSAAGECEVRIVHGDGEPAFAGTLTLPAGAGPHPAALLVSPAGEHPRDELRRGGRHWANLAARLSEHGIATLRVDNRGVGGSANDAWPAWSYAVSLDELARLVEAGLTPQQALRAATQTPALMMGVGDRRGRVAEGQAADLVLLPANPLVPGPVARSLTRRTAATASCA